MLIALCALGGLLIGSFLNVVVYRLPRGESLNRPPSHCPGCGKPVKPYDNIPVISWLLLRGRCRHCDMRISARYPLVELGTAVLCALVAVAKHNTHQSTHDVALGLALVLVLIPVALIDLDHRIIPNKITIPAAVVAVIIGAATHAAGLPQQLIGGAAAGGFLLFFALAYPKGMGMGDVKLAAVMGLFLGHSVAVALLAGVLAGTIYGVGVMSRTGVGEGRKTAVPFGPFLALGGVIAIFAGPAIVHWYLHTVV
jgi:leader peptidase (prepilin peptidase)/N-methyltransferase